MATGIRSHPLDRTGPDPDGVPMALATARGPGRPGRARRRELLAWVFTTAGMVVVGFGWYGISGEARTWRQLPYLLSGGVGGASLVAVGVALLVSSEHAHDREAIETLAGRLDAIERDLGARPDRSLGPRRAQQRRGGTARREG